MAGRHALYRHGVSAVHLAPAHVKIVAVVGFVVAVVVTPREAVWAFGGHLAIIAIVLTAARLPPGFVARRLLVVTPFLLAAATLPFVAGPPGTALGMSVEGLWGAWNITAKAVLGALASISLAATTEPPEIVAGLERLRMPRIVTAIMGFMVRYVEIVASDISRMRRAMRARGYRPRWLGSVGAIGSSLGALFVRSFERGERVFLAMTARGYVGTMPVVAGETPASSAWMAAALLVTAAWSVGVLGMLT